jgi:hypothetical protein
MKMRRVYIEPQTFNPKVYYLSYEYYDNGNLLPLHMHPFR